MRRSDRIRQQAMNQGIRGLATVTAAIALGTWAWAFYLASYACAMSVCVLGALLMGLKGMTMLGGMLNGLRLARRETAYESEVPAFRL